MKNDVVHNNPAPTLHLGLKSTEATCPSSTSNSTGKVDHVTCHKPLAPAQRSLLSAHFLEEVEGLEEKDWTHLRAFPMG